MPDNHLEDSIFGAGGTVERSPARPPGPRPASEAALGPDPRTPSEIGDPGRHPGAGSPRRRAGRRRRAGIRFLVLLLSLLLVGGAGWVALGYLRPVVAGFTASDDYTGSGTGRTTVLVRQGDTGRTIGARLQSAGVVKTAKAFSTVLAAHPSDAQVQPGSYTLRLRMSAASALAMLLNPRNRSVPHVIIREGLWRTEIYAALSRATGTPVSAYVAAARHPAQLDLPPSARGNVEGYLFPATYEFDADASATVQLRAMVDKARAELTALHVPAAGAERIVTIASIVQAEARRPGDFAKVARVIDNRLAARQKLQLDSTVSYAAHRRSITTTDAERARRSAWNTYHVAGLPAGPIDNPGVAALQAALHPAPGPWRYFVAVNPVTGETRFAVTGAQHAANERLFQRWCSTHPGKC